MVIERTLSIIKPDAVEKNVIGEIYSRFESNGLKNKMIDMNTLSDTIGYCDGGNTERLYKHLLSLKNERQ